MNQFLAGFGDELLKTAFVGGALKFLGRQAVKHPILALGTAGTLASTGISSAKAYKSGLRGGEKARYLHAQYDPRTRQAMPSDAALTNYNVLFNRKVSPKEIKALHKHYDERKFKR